MTKFMIFYFEEKKAHLLFLNFPHNLLKCSVMVLFKGLKIPKIMGWMDWLATLKVYKVKFEPNQHMSNIVEFLCYPLHLQNFLLWHSLSRVSSRSLCVHRLLSSRSRYFLFFSSLGFQFSKKCLKFLFLRLVIVEKRL